MSATSARDHARAPRRLRIAELEARLAISRRTIERWCAAGTFPRPHYLRPLKVRFWWTADVDAWEAAHLEEAAGERTPRCTPAAASEPPPVPAKC
jgi:predicted DNA-binding transcriptional regulator AlpA